MLTLEFPEDRRQPWSYQVTIPGDDISGGTAGTPFDISGASGT